MLHRPPTDKMHRDAILNKPLQEIPPQLRSPKEIFCEGLLGGTTQFKITVYMSIFNKEKGTREHCLMPLINYYIKLFL